MILVLESLKRRRVTIREVHTSEMIADGLTKTIVGRHFDIFVNRILGMTKDQQAGVGYN
jgi:hypothetical protein